LTCLVEADVELRLDVHDVANSATPLGTLSEAYDQSITISLQGGTVSGSLRFGYDHGSPGHGLLQHRRRVRVSVSFDGGAWTPVETFVIVAMPDDLRHDGPVQVPTTRVECEHLTQALGAGRGGGILWPEGWPSQRYATNPRAFGWMMRSYDDSHWDSPPPYPMGSQTSPTNTAWDGFPANWPEVAGPAVWIAPRPTTPTPNGGIGHPQDHWYVRDRMQGSYVGPARLFIAADDRHQTYMNGRPIGTGRDFRDVQQIDVYMTGDDVLAVRVYNIPTRSAQVNNPSALLYAVCGVDDDTGELELLYASGPHGRIRTYDFGLPTPGVSVGHIFGTVLSENQTHGFLGWAHWTFTSSHTSDAVPWEKVVNYQLRLQRAGRVADELHRWEGEVYVAADGEVVYVHQLGEDRAVTVDAQFAFALEGQGPMLTAGLWESAGRFGFADVAGAEPMADMIEYGTGLDETEWDLAGLLEEGADPPETVDIDWPDGIRPWLDAGLGDRLTLRDGSFELPVRVMELSVVWSEQYQAYEAASICREVRA
jgi:hypothetical protein